MGQNSIGANTRVATRRRLTGGEMLDGMDSVRFAAQVLFHILRYARTS
jgi:predicted CDP-diglyceride synthetase/phosphatidate cytidylyltransferase